MAVHLLNTLNKFFPFIFIFSVFILILLLNITLKKMTCSITNKPIKEEDMFSPYYFFPVIYFAYYYLGNFIYSLINFQSETICRKIFIYALYGLIFYYFGLFMYKYIFKNKEFYSKKKYTYRLNIRKLKMILNFFIFLNLVSFFVIFYFNKIFFFIPGHTELTRFAIYYSTSPKLQFFLITFAYNFGILIVVLISILKKYLGKPLFKFDRWILILFITTILLPLMSGTRVRAINNVITLILIYHYLFQRIKPKKIITTFLIFLLLISFYGNLRRTNFTDFSLNGILYVCSHELTLGVSNFNLILNNFPSAYGFMYGRGMFSRLIGIITPGHQEGLGTLLKDAGGIDYLGGGTTSTLLGNLYLDFGNLGIILGMFLFGFIFNIFYLNMKKDLKYIPFYCFTTSIMLTNLRGGLVTVVYYIEVTLILYLVLKICLVKQNIKEENMLNP